MLCFSICQRLKYIYVVSLLLPMLNSSLLSAVTIESSTEKTTDGTSISTSVINRSNKLIRNPTIPKTTIRVDNHSNRDDEKNGDRSKQLLVALSSKSYISKPNATSPTPAKLTKRAGSAAEIKHKKISKENLNRTGDVATRGKLRQEVDHIPDSSGHIPYRISRPHLGLSGYESSGVSSSANDGGDDYHNLSFESDKWPSDYWERDYNKNFLYNNTRVHHIEAECQDDYMKIRIGFNATFNGLIYSAGYAYDPDCMYINGSGRDYYEFFIQLNRCGTLGKNALHEEKRKNPTNFMWNTVTVQYNPLIEEEYDEHFKVTCEYGYDFWKTVTFPFLDVEVATGNPVVFTLSPPECYMEIQNGYGIGGPRVTGPVRVGDPLTLIIYMRSKYDGFDIVVNDCYAHNGANKKIQLIDEYGCPVDDKLISRFRGSWSDSGIFETQVYAYMKTFRFTGSPALYIECDVRMCHGRCPSQPCHWRNSKTVSKRDISNSTTLNLQSALDSTASEVDKTNSSQNPGNSLEVDIMTTISNSEKQPASLSENLNLFQSLRVLQEGESDGDGVYSHSRRLEPLGNQTCMKTTTLSALTITLSVAMCILSGTLVVTCSRLKRRSKDASLYETYITHKGQID
ncbi:uncharacterized protein [Bactrocera oleae]|uniref:uncharacterized protein n=1 Tax=Bactrocera oleae TaxID=104688 RepID=UPI00387EACC9